MRDDNTLRRLIKEHGSAVANYLRRRIFPLSRDDLDDLVEETFLVVWRRIDEVPADAELAWIIGVARNVLRNAKRAQHRRWRMESSLGPQRRESSAEAWLLASESVRLALQRLKSSDREVLLLSNWDGLSARGIATVLGISEKAASVRTSRAESRFQAALSALEDPVNKAIDVDSEEVEQRRGSPW